MTDLYNEFLETLEEKPWLPIMVHLPSSIQLAKKYYDGYLTEEELSERQLSGRYWDIVEDKTSADGYDLFITLDNETILYVTKSPITRHYIESVYNRENSLIILPKSLRGRYYPAYD